ncbi:hypothetical protein ACIPYS_09705 [Kitasatospora sp. NPDC089913]|uniref:hypothetical protein n=1 Tax=Kitasatospora sp. NPDC089913 TaxID=3364080 RepID=UPI00380BE132
MFETARAALAEGRDDVQELFDRAAAGAGPEMLWRITDAFVGAFDGRAAGWMSRAIESSEVAEGIRVHPGTLQIVVDHGYPVHQCWDIEVRSSAEDRPAVVAALNAAEPRLIRLTDDGRELSATEWEVALERGVDFYSPNYAAVEPDPVPRIRLDCKDAVMPLMSRAVIRVLLEELASAGVRQAVLSTDPRPRSQ